MVDDAISSKTKIKIIYFKMKKVKILVGVLLLFVIVGNSNVYALSLEEIHENSFSKEKVVEYLNNINDEYYSGTSFDSIKSDLSNLNSDYDLNVAVVIFEEYLKFLKTSSVSDNDKNDKVMNAGVQATKWKRNWCTLGVASWSQCDSNCDNCTGSTWALCDSYPIDCP
ncbi:MAG: hypothetical protein LBP53_05815 [Candidatus Peribacteria bacterium]|jgi:hypothetical protein|nr:hypothetical protein [Candidatus Peribacteria bacterium]